MGMLKLAEDVERHEAMGQVLSKPAQGSQCLQIVAKPKRVAHGRSKPEPKLTRIAFKVSRLMEFCSERELQNQTGHSTDDWPLVVAKETMDNALDACEEAEVGPDIRPLSCCGRLLQVGLQLIVRAKSQIIPLPLRRRLRLPATPRPLIRCAWCAPLWRGQRSRRPSARRTKLRPASLISCKVTPQSRGKPDRGFHPFLVDRRRASALQKKWTFEEP
jgi:hypothetical protein